MTGIVQAIEVFIDGDTIETLEELMAHQGYLDGRDTARSFRMLRSNSLIWHYFVHGYLYEEAGHETPQDWLRQQKEIKGSCWSDWTAWLAPRIGPKVPPPPLATKAYPRLDDAPAPYVKEA